MTHADTRTRARAQAAPVTGPSADASKGPSADASKGPSADTSRGPSADTSKGPSADTSKGPSADTSGMGIDGADAAERTPLRVRFEPAGVEIDAELGVSLYDLALMAGVDTDAPCGGQGRCGRCRVRLADPRARSAFVVRSNARLSPDDAAAGYLLACQTFVVDPERRDAALSEPTMPDAAAVAPAAATRPTSAGGLGGPVTVIVPPRKKETVFPTGHAAAQPEALPVSCDWRRDPAVRTFVLDIEPPSLADQTTDLDRLRRALAQQHGIEELRAGLGVLHGLAHTLRDADWKVAATLEMRDRVSGAYLPPRLVDIRPTTVPSRTYGLAVDVGTTSVVAYLVDFGTGQVVDTASAYNAQIACGEDVISRIVYSQRGDGLARLQTLVIGTINELVDELAQRNHLRPDDVHEVVAAGNTTMTHLLLGLDPKYIREEPYIPTVAVPPRLTAAELGLGVNPQARVYCLPGVGSYVGGDITAGVISSGMFATDKLTLFIDVGTNGEMVLGNKEWLISCACSAGPAFEGGGVGHGMRATSGAVEDIWVNSETFAATYTTIDNAPPQGICGSGLIDLLGELFVTGVIDKGGRLNRALASKTPRVRKTDRGWEYVVAWAAETGVGHDIVLTEGDVGNLVRAKAAIYAGFSVLCRSVGIEVGDVEQILIGGAFGQYISVEKAIEIGLLPDQPVERFHFLGNTSALGAYRALLCVTMRREVLEVARKMTYLELSADNSFMEEYTSALFLPHTDLDAFPTVKAQLKETA